MNWTEITIKVPQKDTDLATAIANMTVPYGIYIEDYSDLEEKAEEIAHINLIDEELLEKDRTFSLIHIYISECDNALEAVEFLKERFSAENINFEVTSIGVDDADWNENWKKYFHTSKIGNKLVIVPSWEEYENNEGRVVLNIDPGAAFGTGTHATTSLCLGLLEDYITNDTDMLDIGTGSGILSIASVLLGAKTAIGVDIDAQSVKTAKENAEINNVSDKCEFIVGDLADKISGKFKVVCANIVADVIIKLFDGVENFLAEDGVFIISGIIDIRKEDVLKKAIDKGFTICEEMYKDNWCAFVCKLK
jgi:ribosomal protein L11 methyltransferase